MDETKLYSRYCHNEKQVGLLASERVIQDMAAVFVLGVKFTPVFVTFIFIDDLQLSFIEVETLLLKCDYSNSMCSDQVPSFVLQNASNILAPRTIHTYTKRSNLA